MNKTNKQLYNYYKKKERHWTEAMFDCYNRRFEVVRTLFSAFAFLLQIFIFLKVFGVM